MEDAHAAHINIASLNPNLGTSLRSRSPGSESQASTCSGTSLAPTLSTSFGSDRSSLDPESLSFFGVYDGHGGADTAQHCSDRMHLNFSEALASLLAASSCSSPKACRPLPPSRFSDCEMRSRSSSMQSSATIDDHSGSPMSSQPPTPSVADAHATVHLRGQAATGCSADSSCGGMLEGRHSQLHSPSGSSSGCSSSGCADPRLPCIVEALRQAFQRTDDELSGTEIGELVGSTAVVAVVGPHTLHVAHTGDSRAVLMRQGVAVPLTSDHKPDRPDEMARIERANGKVVYKSGGFRVMGLLAMSRAMGDHFLRPWVLPEPEIACVPRTEADELLMLASDGVWDVFSNQEAASLALKCVQRARERGASRSAACRVAAKVVTKAAIERGSHDNVTCVLVDLRRADEEEATAKLLQAHVAPGVPQRGPTLLRTASTSGNGRHGHAVHRPPISRRSRSWTGTDTATRVIATAAAVAMEVDAEAAAAGATSTVHRAVAAAPPHQPLQAVPEGVSIGVI